MLGPVLMAYLPQDEIDRLLERNPLTAATKRSLVKIDDLKEFLRRVREQGFAVDDEGAIEGVGGVGAPIRDFTGRVIGGIGVGFISSSVDAKALKQIVKEVTGTARAISREAGYNG